MRALTIPAAAVLLCCSGGCGDPTAPPLPTRENVVLLMVDTLRADHLSCYGYARNTSPEIDAFGAEALVFERARSQSACTYPSVNSLLTSRYPAVFHAQGAGKMGIPDGVPSLAELLHRAGYATIAVSASPIVRATPSNHNPGAGFGRGFDVFEESAVWREAALVNQLAMQHLATVKEPFFLYLHYMDPHDPYVPPKIHQQRFTASYSGHAFIAAGDPNPIGEMLYDDGPQIDLDAEDLEHLVDLYDEEIAYFDHEFGKLLHRLDELGLLDTSWVILTADHGEEFMEHGHIKHCRDLFDTQTRTPLMVRPPGGCAPRRIEHAVANLDIVPTVLDMLAIETGDVELDGVSLRPLLEGGALEREIVFSDQGKWRSADDGHDKLILDGLEFSHQLYDLRQDAGETTDVFDPDSAVARRLGRALRAWLETPHGGIGNDEAIAAAQARERELKALGYLQ